MTHPTNRAERLEINRRYRLQRRASSIRRATKGAH